MINFHISMMMAFLLYTATAQADWTTLRGNPQRTGFVDTEIRDRVVTLFDVGKRIMDLSEWLATPLLSIYDQSNQLPSLVCEETNVFAHHKLRSLPKAIPLSFLHDWQLFSTN